MTDSPAASPGQQTRALGLSTVPAARVRGVDGLERGGRQAPALGFDYSADQLFWLAALPGLSGATLRIFYSSMVTAPTSTTGPCAGGL